MKSILGKLTVGSLIALGGTAFLGWSKNDARAQSPCISQCLTSGSSEGTCRNYCLGNRATRVYGYSSTNPAPNPTTVPANAYYFSGFYDNSDYAGRPVARCWPGYRDANSNYPCWAQEAFDRDDR